MADSTTSQNSGENGFWSTLASGIGGGIATVAKEILPVWTAKQLKLQQDDQLRHSTFAPEYLQDGSYIPAVFDTENYATNQLNLSPTAIALAALGVGAVVLLLRRRA